MSIPRSNVQNESAEDVPLIERRYEIDFLLLNIRQGMSCQIIGPPGRQDVPTPRIDRPGGPRPSLHRHHTA